MRANLDGASAASTSFQRFPSAGKSALSATCAAMFEGFFDFRFFFFLLTFSDSAASCGTAASVCETSTVTGATLDDRLSFINGFWS